MDQDTPWGLLETALDGTILRANPRFASWTGRPAQALQAGTRWKELLAPSSLILYETHFVPRLQAHRSVNEVALDLQRPDGSRFPVLACALRTDDRDDGEAVIAITVFDATETRRFERDLRAARRQAEDAVEALSASNLALQAQHEQLRVTLRAIADAVVTTDVAGLITSVNPTAEAISGVKSADALGATVDVLGRVLDPKTREPIVQAWRFARRSRASSGVLFQRHDGREHCISGTVATIRDATGTAVGTVFVCRDVTQARAAAVQLAHDASHDHLTGLYNRREFERRVVAALRARSVGEESDLLLYVDLDQFKVINDTAGHTAGDQALVKVATLFRQTLRQSDVLARLGGDEFGVLLNRCPVESGYRVAEELRLRLQELRFVWGETRYGLTASIGLAVLPHGGHSAESALSEADMACIAAKEAGRNRVHRFDSANDQMALRRQEMDWLSRIRRGLDEGRFQLYFQPIVPVGGGARGHRHGELLLRLRDDDGRVLGPGTFISAAERFNQMQQVDRWVVRRAFGWLETAMDVSVSINVSGQSFGDPAFLSYVTRQLADRAFDPSRVCIEITETAAIGDIGSAHRFITELRGLGVKFALDDFGAGLSSFNYLRTLQVDFVKIDGSFVKSLLTDPVHREIVESIHRIARACRLRTVAEWVEDDATLQALASIGIDFAQGWYTGRPEAID